MDKIALIGDGYWGSKIKKYIPEFFELKYIVDSKFDKNIIWQDEEIKAVIIATPIETHYEMIKKALNNGKHVFSEKPVTLFKDQSMELSDIAIKKGLFIGVDYVQTFSKSIKEAVNWVHNLGGVEYIEMSTKHLGRFLNPDVYWLLASHHLSILDMFIDIENICFEFQDHLYHNNLCTTGSIVFDCGRIDVSTNFPGKEMLINFYCPKGTVKYRPEEDGLHIVLYDKTYKVLPSKLTVREFVLKYDEKNNLRYAIKYFKNLIEGNVISNMNRSTKITGILERR